MPALALERDPKRAVDRGEDACHEQQRPNEVPCAEIGLRLAHLVERLVMVTAREYASYWPCGRWRAGVRSGTPEPRCP